MVRLVELLKNVLRAEGRNTKFLSLVSACYVTGRTVHTWDILTCSTNIYIYISINIIVWPAHANDMNAPLYLRLYYTITAAIIYVYVDDSYWFAY